MSGKRSFGDLGEEKRTSSRKSEPAVEVALPPFPLYSSHGQGQNERSDCTNFQEAFNGSANLFRGRKNVLVLAGAGISVSCGIPDFRSKGTGLYSTLDAEAIGLNDPQELFDLEVFKEDPRPFYSFAKNLYPGSIVPSVSHRFLALLHQRGMLLRVYTQNIDGLEEIAGVPKSKVVHAHGSLTWAQCTKCRARMDSSEIANDVKNGTVPRCSRQMKSGHGELKRKPSLASSVDSSEQQSSSEETYSRRTRRKTSRMMESGLLSPLGSGESDSGDGGRVSLDALQGSNEKILCGGVIKPGVTFFGEKLDDRVRRKLEADREKADCLVIIGTSLSVAPMSKVIQYLKPTIPRILINRNMVKAPKHNLGEDVEGSETDFRDGYVFDACLLGFCDDVTRALAKKISSWEPFSEGKSDKRAVSVEQEGKALCNVEDDCTGPNGNINGIHNHETARVVLFPGAVLDDVDSDSDVTFEEVAHCDACQGQIHGSIMKCVDCFDYDLCLKCFPKTSKKHHNGAHKFARE